jgi:Ni,Fe-hydrogenase III component G
MPDLTADDVKRLRALLGQATVEDLAEAMQPNEEHSTVARADFQRAIGEAAPALLDAWEEREEAWTALGVSKEGREENDDPDVETLAQSIGIAMQYERDMREQAEGVAKELRARLTEAENKNEALRAALEDSDG